MNNPSAFASDTKGNIYIVTDWIRDFFLYEHADLEFTNIISQYQLLGMVGN